MQSLRCAVIRSQPLFRLRSGASSSFGGIAFQKYSPLARYSSKSDGPHDPYHFEVNKPEDVLPFDIKNNNALAVKFVLFVAVAVGLPVFQVVYQWFPFFVPFRMTTSSSTSSTRTHSAQPWVEKYRPRNLDEIAAQGRVVAVLKKAVAENNLPHLMFYGPAGTGKTSTILAVARDIFGEHFKERVLELNASDDRGIAVVRHKVKDFAKTVVASSVMTIQGTPLPPYKLIILDEADSMTSEAQAALRRTMETYSATTRFCIICNYVNKIMEPLGSRCAKFRFQPVEQSDALARLQYIATSEKLQASEEVLKFLINFSEGDLRKAINLLQSAHRFISQQQPSIESAKELSLEFVHELTGFIPSLIVETFLQQVPSSLDKAVTLSADIVRSGYSVTQFISQLHTLLLSKYDIQSLQKSLLATKFALYENRLLDGADAELQLMSLATDMAEYLSPHKKQVSVYSI